MCVSVCEAQPDPVYIYIKAQFCNLLGFLWCYASIYLNTIYLNAETNSASFRM